MSRRRALLVVALLVVAGCSGVDAPWSTSDERSLGSDQTGTPASPQSADNPWGKKTLIVAVENDASPWRNVTRLVAQALSYWERNDDQYARYEMNYSLQESASDPDVIVRFVTSIRACGAGSGDGGVGYVRRITSGTTPDHPEEVCVRAGYADPATRTVIEHEFGHLLGLTHEDEPQPLMTSRRARLPIPRPGQRVREHAWARERITVYSDYEGIYARRERIARDQINHTLAYYARGAEGTLQRNVTFAWTTNRSRADIVISFTGEPTCRGTVEGACGELVRRPDGSLQFVFSVVNMHEDAIGWYFGYWLGYTFDASRKADLPPAFQNASYDERRDAWWEYRN